MSLFDQASEAMSQFFGTQAEVVQLIAKLPDVLRDAGQQMHDAGVGADVAADLLTNDLLDLSNSAADLLERIHRNTATFANLLGDVGDRIRSVPLMGDVAAPFTQVLQTAREMSDSMERVSQQVRDIGVGLSAVGEGLGTMAASLKASGTALAAVSDTGISMRTMVPTAAAQATEQAARTAMAAAAVMRAPVTETARRTSDVIAAATGDRRIRRTAEPAAKRAVKRAARKSGAKKTAGAKKAGARKKAAKKTAAKKAGKKAGAKKAGAEKSSPGKTAAKKAAGRTTTEGSAD